MCVCVSAESDVSTGIWNDMHLLAADLGNARCAHLIIHIIYIIIHIIYTHFTRAFDTNVRVYVCLYLYIYVCVRIHRYIYMYVYIWHMAYVRIYMRISMHAYISAPALTMQ